MSTKTQTSLAINVRPDFLDRLQERAEERGLTVRDYVLEALLDHMQRETEEEDRRWGELADEAIQEGFLSVEESERYFASLKDA